MKSVDLLKELIALKVGGEERPQQEQAVETIDEALTSKKNLLLEAPTGSGKTLSYLIPIVNNNVRAVVSTATKQLSEQIVNSDAVFLNQKLKELGISKQADVALLKGRDNYLCKAKLEDSEKLDKEASTLFNMEEVQSETINVGERAREVQSIVKWAKTTETGDQSEAPTVSDPVWRSFSSTNAECPGRANCPFGDVCFAEIAREKAQQAQIAVTNHAVTALDLSADGVLLGDRDVFVFDELHELDNYLSSAWGAEMSKKRIEDMAKLLKGTPSLTPSLVERFNKLVDEYDTANSSLPHGLIDNQESSVVFEKYWSNAYSVSAALAVELESKMKDAADTMKRVYSKLQRSMNEIVGATQRIKDTSPLNVRWIHDSTKVWQPPNRKQKADAKQIITVHASPMQVGPKLQSHISDRQATMIGLSATVTVGKKFDVPLYNFGLDKKNTKTLALDTPFNYQQQAMLYIPKQGTFPEPVGQERLEFAAAMQRDSKDLIEAVKGRALILSTTISGVNKLAEYYRSELPHLRFLVQGEAPNAHLVKEFIEDETSCLIGTMGFWHGLDVPGPALSLCIIDKIPFPTPDDPLMEARRDWADKNQRNGFMEIFVTVADNMMRQGFGRAIRSKSDKAVVAIYDTRLLTKAYGLGIVRNLFGVNLFHDKEKVVGALKRLASAREASDSN